jgi:hypothetical protein
VSRFFFHAYVGIIPVLVYGFPHVCVYICDVVYYSDTYKLLSPFFFIFRRLVQK